MTATCREACRSVQPRFTISELFERGYRPLSIKGERHADADGNFASFSLDTADGKIVAIGSVRPVARR